MADHTPGPWKARARCVFNDGTQDEIAGLGWDIEGPPEPQLRGQFSRAADAEFIVRACNTHDELLAALERMVGCVTRLRNTGCQHGDDWAILAEAEDAIARAKGM